MFSQYFNFASKLKIKKSTLQKIEEICNLIKNENEMPDRYFVHKDSENIDISFFEEYYKKQQIMFLENEKKNVLYVRDCNEIEKLEYYQDEYPFLKVRKKLKINYMYGDIMSFYLIYNYNFHIGNCVWFALKF